MTAVARRKSPEGVATTELICGAAKGASDGLFPQILSLHVAPGSIVADVTYGKGVFWRQVEAGLYDVLATDIATGVDCRDLPHGDGDIDCVVLDPPFMEGLFRARRESLAGNGPHSNFRECHSCRGSGPFGTLAVGTGMVFDLDKVLVGGSAIQRRVRAHVVVEELILSELWGDVGDGEGAVVAVPELDAGGPVGALDAPPKGRAAVSTGAFAAAGRGGGCAGPCRPARSRP
jgi:hypothetical protein